MGMYDSLWRYAEIVEFFRLCVASAVAVSIFVVVTLLLKNKKRGTQVVKLHVPFLFFFCTWCGTNHTECRAGGRRANHAAASF